jgi:hypothetical protein
LRPTATGMKMIRMSDEGTSGERRRPPAQPRVLLRTAPAFVLLILVSFACNWYYLKGGFQADEYFFLNMMRQEPRPYSRGLGFWAVDDIPALSNVWWFEGGDLGVFWRPLPSLIFEASVRVFGERAFPLHLLSIVVHGLVGGTLFLLVRRLTGRPLVALLAGLFFLTCEDHSMTVGWIATVTDLVCVLFVNLALLAHTVWLDTRNRWAFAASLTALVLALLSKESAVVAPLAIVLLTVALPQGRDRELPRPGVSYLRDWLSWAPALTLLIAYLVLYRLLGFGGISSGMYVDPFAHPGRYLTHLVAHLPVMWLATLSPVPPSFAMFWPATIPLLAAGGVVAFIVWIAGLWWLRRSALVAWAMAFYLLALLPQMSTDASERCLYFPAVGSSILLAILLVQIGPIARRIARASPRAPVFTRIVGWGGLACVLVPGIVLSAMMPFMYVPSFGKLREQVATALPHVRERHPDHVLLLNTPGFFHAFYPPTIVEYYAGRPLDVRVLSAVNGVMSVERVDDGSFILRADRAGWLTNVFAALLRSPGRLKPGRVYEKRILTATLLEMTQDGRDVLAVRFDMDRRLDDPQVLFLQWDREAFRPIDLAALPAGEIVTLADTSDVWGSMW